jgi:DNA polymerase-1
VRTLLVDADSLIYASAAANEVFTDWGDGTSTVHSNFDGARIQLEDQLKEIQERLNADVCILALSDYTDPWRKKVLPSYKYNRVEKRKPELLKPLRQYVREVHHVFQRPGLEGDDILGILGTAKTPPTEVKGERIICSLDKDMKTLPGLHYNWRKDDKAEPEPVISEVTEQEADRFHMTQTLTGDSTDGYKGCPKIGPKKAEKILGATQTVAEMWPLVVSAYNKAGLTEQDALTQARVARICRATDFDFDKREVKLWKP